MAPNNKISVSKLARTLRVGRSTLEKHLKRHNVNTKYTNIRKAELDTIVKAYRRKKPAAGRSYISGHLRRHGVYLQRRRITASMKRVDGIGAILRRRRIIERGKYSVPRPHALWHIDGHHKLILWGIVIHGIIDGYSRTVRNHPLLRTRIDWPQMIGLKASTNNKATTVLEVFLKAVGEYGEPSRVRGDRGGENKRVSLYMVLKRGLGRASFIWGSYVVSSFSQINSLTESQ